CVCMCVCFVIAGAHLGRLTLLGTTGVQQFEGNVHRHPRDPGMRQRKHFLHVTPYFPSHTLFSFIIPPLHHTHTHTHTVPVQLHTHTPPPHHTHTHTHTHYHSNHTHTHTHSTSSTTYTHTHTHST